MIRPVSDYVKSVTELANFIGIESDLNLEFSGITSDSRGVNSGDLFVALPGANSHGASYIDDVVASGAIGVITDEAGAKLIGKKLPVIEISNPRRFLGAICSWFYGSPSSTMQLVGITGTNGKTTTTTILNQILVAAGKSTGLIGTVGIEIGPEKLTANYTTPEASELQSLLATMGERHISHVSMEVSSHALEARRVAGTKFSIVGFTNLTQDHLDFHHTMDEYFLAKSKLFTSNFSECALINIDDPYGKRLFANCDISSVSISTSVGDWQLSLSDLQLTSPSGKRHIFDSPLVGDFNQMNAAMALVAFVQTGGDMEEGIELLRRFPGVPGRLEQVGTGSPLVLVDYAHTPDAVTRVLASLRTHTRGRIIAVSSLGSTRVVPSYGAIGISKAALESTVRYLGIEVDDALEISEQTEI